MHQATNDSKTKLQPPLQNRISEMIESMESVHLRPDADENIMGESCNESDSGTSGSDTSDETQMPSPLPYYHYKLIPLIPEKQSEKESEVFVSYCSNSEEELRLRYDLQSSRPQHNRRMGSTPEFCSDEQQKMRLASRVAEFEALLTDL